MKRKGTLLFIAIATSLILCSLMGCLIGKKTPNDTNSQGNDNMITLPTVEDEVVNNASEQEESFEQNKENEKIVEETIPPASSREPAATISQQENTSTPYVEQATTTPQAEQPTTTPVVTEEPSDEETTSPVYDSSNDMGEF